MLNLNFTPFPKLSTERLILRTLKLSDIPDIFFLRSNEIVNKFIDRERAKNHTDARTFINKIKGGVKENKNIYWAITLKEHPKLIGAIGLWNFLTIDKSAEVGYELHPSFHRKGIMNEALRKILNFGFESIKLNSIEAYTHKDNTNSTKLLIKNNFVIDLKRKDETNKHNVIFQIRAKDYTKSGFDQ